MIGIGLMSGTSLDGIDAALVDIQGYGEKTELQLLKTITYPFTEILKEEIKTACDPSASSTPLICQLNVKLGNLFLKACQQVCQEAGLPESAVDFVASHGQTIWHAPSNDPFTSSTLQIGEPSIIAYGLKTTVIADFRVMDMAAGGEGAPLVPYTEYILYRSSAKTRLLQNIGGIGNVTVLPKDGSFHDLFAFDTGPGNMMIDEVMVQRFQQPYDEGGKIAKQGSLIPELQAELKAHPFLAQTPPKSTGREMFGKTFTNELLDKYANEDSYDLVTTLTDFTAYTIAESYRQFVFPKTGTQGIDIVLSGGGAHNLTLQAMLQDYLPESTIMTQEDLGWSNDAKEAIAFAVLGNETLHARPSNAPSATGASAPVILGKIVPNPFAYEQKPTEMK